MRLSLLGEATLRSSVVCRHLILRCKVSSKVLSGILPAFDVPDLSKIVQRSCEYSRKQMVSGGQSKLPVFYLVITLKKIL